MISSLRICICSLFLASLAAPQSWPQAGVSTQVPVSPALPANSLTVPADTSFFAKLMTPIAISQIKSDDTLEAQTTQDVKRGHDVVLKKGSTLLGHVQSVQPPTSGKPQYFVVIVFNRVKPKNSEEMQFNPVIQALAPESDMESRSIAESTGTGLQGATRSAGVTGQTNATRGNINQLSLTSTGVIDLQGLQVGERISDGKHYSVLAASRNDITLKKGTQLVMKAVAQ